MTSDLKKLLNDSAAHAPAERHSVSEIVRSAQRDQRSHTARLVGGAVLALALVAGVGYAALVNGNRDDAEPVHTEPERITIDIADARKAVEGEDYESLSVIDHWMIGLNWSPDDLVPVDPKGGTVSVIDGQDGTSVTELDTPPGGQVPMYVGQDHAVWVVDRNHETVVAVQQLSTGEWTEIPAEVEGHAYSPAILGIEGGRVWLTFSATPEEGQLAQQIVASAPLEGAGGFRREVDGTVNQAELGDGTLAWVADYEEPARVRDLTTGEEQTFEPIPESNRKCIARIEGVSASRLATHLECGGVQTRADDDTHVWSLAGEPTIVIPDGWLPLGGLSEQAIVVQEIGDDRVRTYVYRFDTGEVLRMGAVKTGKFGLPMSMPGQAGGDRITFPASTESLRLAALK